MIQLSSEDLLRNGWAERLKVLHIWLDCNREVRALSFCFVFLFFYRLLHLSESHDIKSHDKETYSFTFKWHSTSLHVLLTCCLSFFKMSCCVTHVICHLHLFENAALGRLVFCLPVGCWWWVQGRGCCLMADKQVKVYFLLMLVFRRPDGHMFNLLLTVCCIWKKWTLYLQWNEMTDLPVA